MTALWTATSDAYMTSPRPCYGSLLRDRRKSRETLTALQEAGGGASWAAFRFDHVDGRLVGTEIISCSFCGRAPRVIVGAARWTSDLPISTPRASCTWPSMRAQPWNPLTDFVCIRSRARTRRLAQKTGCESAGRLRREQGEGRLRCRNWSHGGEKH